MNRRLVDAAVGMLLILVVTVLQFLVSIALGAWLGTGDDALTQARMVNLLFFTSAVPSGIATLLASRLMKSASVVDAGIRGCIWAAIQLLDFLVVGVLNDTARFIVPAPGFYVFLVLVAGGPLLDAWIRRLPGKAPGGAAGPST